MLLVVAGGVSLALGILGVFLPVLPTTPFVLLTAYLWARASERLHGALLRHRWTGPLIRNWQERRGIPLRTKVGTLVVLWGTIAVSSGVMVGRWLSAGKSLWPWRWLVPGLLLAVAVGVTVHLGRFRTLR